MSIRCPFCGEDDFDLYGLKQHLEGFSGMMYHEPCEAFTNCCTPCVCYCQETDDIEGEPTT